MKPCSFPHSWPGYTSAANKQLELGTAPLILGIVGCPGVGKSTLTRQLCDALREDGHRVTVVPMDGYHLADEELRRLDRLDRKGSVETFDAWGYLALLQRIHLERQHTIYAPTFERTLEQPIAGAIPITPDTDIIITEGNYLLHPHDPWTLIRAELDEVWYLEADPHTRVTRLVNRHIQFGKTPTAAHRWVHEVDEANSLTIAATRDTADLIVHLD